MTSVARRQEQDDSGEYSDASQDIEQNNSGNEAGPPESDYDSQRSDSEHSEGDPDKTESSERRVDDDEDRSNPQYIPKRGTFYEHDDRTAASGEESSVVTSETASEKKEGPETPAERRRPPRKSESQNKWSHDKYNENEQMPKSRDELVAIYGYDIRNEDAPPHARRNRRYGRGPNKYTRTWEDEEAYRRQTAQAQHKKPPSPADFPELNAANKPGRKPRVPRPRSKSQPASNESSDSGSQLRRNASIKASKPNRPVKQNLSKVGPKTVSKDKIPPLENLTITANVCNNGQGQPQRKVNATVAQQRPVPTEMAKKKPLPTQPPAQNNVQSKPQPTPQKPASTKPQQQQPPQQTANAANTESRAGSKRYSSLRQRPLAETYSPQQAQQSQQQPQPTQQPQQQTQQHRYADYVPNAPPPANQHQGSPGPIHPQQMIHQVHRTAVSQQPHGPSPPHQPLPQTQHNQQQQVRLGIIEQPPLVAHHTIHNMPQPHSIGQLPPAQGYAPPAMMPAQYMQQGGNNPVFGAAPIYQPPAAYPHQLYQHHNYATQAGGVTYYSCAEQEQTPRAPRRPTAAIPIVRPQASAQGTLTERNPNSSDKENIDRIVENMFVRKPWPATPGGDSKEKTQERNSQEPHSKESSQPNSLTSSSVSIDSKPSESRENRPEDEKPEERKEKVDESPESISTDA